MSRTNFNELLEAGVHFGHLKRKWNPSMAPYIFMERNGIHILDLHKTEAKINDAAIALKNIAKSGRKILFVATKKQAKEIVAEKVQSVNMPYITERWSGGMLTNFPTIRKAVKKMAAIDKMSTDGTFNVLSKRERLQIARQRAKLEKTLGSIADLTRLPAAMFIVDVSKENIAVKEAQKLQIPVFGMVDTNSDPLGIDFVVPANDDASKSIALVVDIMTEAIKEGLAERKSEKDKEETKEKKSAKTPKAEVKEEVAEKVEAKEEKAEAVVEEVKEVVVEAKKEKADEAKEEKKAPKAAATKKAPAKKAPAKKAPAKAAAKKAPAKKAPAKKAEK